MALFERDGTRFVPTDASRGPWEPGTLNGGAVAALVATAAEAHDDGAAGILPDHLLARLTVDLLRPVPMAPLDVRTTTLRAGRKIQLVEVVVEADGRVVTRATALRMPASRVEAAAIEPPPPVGPDDGDLLAQPGGDVEYFHADGCEVRVVRPEVRGKGPTVIWVRLRHDVVEGESTSPVALAAAASDYGSPLGSSVIAEGWRGVNTDISLHLHRAPIGPWVCVVAQSRYGAGVGQATGTVFDPTGSLGNVTQTVLLEPWQRPS